VSAATLAVVTLALLGASELLSLAFTVAGTPLPPRPWPMRLFSLLLEVAIIALCVTVL
jgi:hypothetical protein